MPPRRSSATLPQLDFIFTADGFVPDVRRDLFGQPRLAPESLPWHERFEAGRFGALYELGMQPAEPWHTASMAFLQRLASAFFRATVTQADIERLRGAARPDLDAPALTRLAASVPFVPGAEHVGPEWIEAVFARLSEIFAEQIGAWEGSVEQYVAEHTQDLRVPGRIFFHLVENKDDDTGTHPFAFIATYAAETGPAAGAQSGRVTHHPLRYALTEYEDDSRKLLELLGGLTRAAEESPLLAELMATGELFHPVRLSAAEAHEFLRSIPAFEAAGILCRVPNWWKSRASSPTLAVRIGENPANGIGAAALVGLTPSIEVDGVALTPAEVRDLLARTEGLAFLKGKWVEVDHARLAALLDAYEKADGQTLNFFEALRQSAAEPKLGGLVETTRGAWLEGFLTAMRNPDAAGHAPVPATLEATLRPYQESGYGWLTALGELGLGACLADDMGLGKTLQFIAFLEGLRARHSDAMRALLVVPASLLGNWSRELERFAPHLDFQVLHGASAAKLSAPFAGLDGAELRAALAPLTITTYAMARKIEPLGMVEWDVLALDEAQAIKNPNVKQTKALKTLTARMRVALTGTPVENDLANLWSIFDFLNPGMLGTLAEFKRYAKDLEAAGSYAMLRRQVAPFLLRRLKTDKTIIADLPDKHEISQFVGLTRKQTILYRKIVAELESVLEGGEGSELTPIRRSGLVLGSIMKLKQICNHPDQFLGSGAFEAKDSAKFVRLAELCEEIYGKRERVLVFTQFREMCEPLAALLEGVFERPGLVLHGGIRPAERTALVERFQGEEYVPFMVLSIKAGGTGLNLTAANHVIHFDRWWNPAVENQATDRTFRIGQTRDVMVHKLIAENTLEERIDKLIAEKQALAEETVGAGETWLTRMGDAELLDILSFGGGDR